MSLNVEFCRQCGAGFAAVEWSNGFCGVKCEARYGRTIRRRPTPKNCKACGDPIDHLARPRHHYCSDNCKYVSDLRRQRKRYHEARS